MTGGSTSAVPLALVHRFTADKGQKLLTVDLPSLESLQGLDLDISSTELRLLLPGSAEHLRIELPHEISANSTPPEAKFSRKRGQLTVAWAEAREESVPEISGATELTWIEKVGTPAKAPQEERPCLDLLQGEVEHALKQCTVERLNRIAQLSGSSMLLGDFDVKGEATVEKRTCRFSASVSFTWEALDAFGGLLGARGVGHVSELTQDSTSPHVVVKTSSGSGVQAKAAGEWMKRHGSGIIAESLKGEVLSAAVLSAAQMHADPDMPEVAQLAKAETAPGVLKDVEDKPMTQWSETWIMQKLGGLTIRLFGGMATATISTPQVTGDASLSVREGRVVSRFLLRVECTWVAAVSAGGGKDVRGTLLLPDFTSEKSIEDSTVCIEAAPGQKSTGQLVAALRQYGVASVRTVLAQFVTELQLQCGP